MQRVNLNVNYALQLIIMYQYWFINSNKYTTLMQEVNNRGNCVCWRAYVGTLPTICSI